MDGLRSEEVRRQKTAILKHFGLTEKTDPKKVMNTLFGYQPLKPGCGLCKYAHKCARIYALARALVMLA
jgi:hypothetical protein